MFVRATLVKPNASRIEVNDGSEATAVTENSVIGAEISREISVRVTRLLVKCFFAVSPFFLLNVRWERE